MPSFDPMGQRCQLAPLAGVQSSIHGQQGAWKVMQHQELLNTQCVWEGSSVCAQLQPCKAAEARTCCPPLEAAMFLAEQNSAACTNQYCWHGCCLPGQCHQHQHQHQHQHWWMGGWLLLKIGPAHHQLAERARELPAPQTPAWRLPAGQSPPAHSACVVTLCLINCSLKTAKFVCLPDRASGNQSWNSLLIVTSPHEPASGHGAPC